MAKKGTKIGDYTRPRLNKIIDQRVAAEVSEGAGVDTTGTPADNQIAIFTDSNTLEGSENLTYDGTTFAVSGSAVQLTGSVITLESPTIKLPAISAGTDNTVLVYDSTRGS